MGVYKKIMDSICDKLLEKYNIKDLEIKLPAYYLYNNNYHDHIKEITKKIEEYKSYTEYIINKNYNKNCVKQDDLKALIETEKTIIHYQLKMKNENNNDPLRARGNLIKIRENDINSIGKIGSGNFGQVYKGILTLAKGLVVTQDEKASNQIYVAIKMTKPGVSTVELMKESLFMSKLGIHPNIVSLIGINYSYNKMLLQFCEQGELLQFLKTNGYRLDQSDKLCMCKHIANGMEYIASKKIVHRDLAARNVLIYTGGICKVADFGMSTEMYKIDNDNINYEYKETENIPTPIRWYSLELCKNIQNNEPLIFSEKTDVWSFGIVMIEIYKNGCLPYHEMRNNYDVIDEIISNYRIPQDDKIKCPDDIYNIISSCWEEFNTRTNFKQIKIELDDIAIKDYHTNSHYLSVAAQQLRNENEVSLENNNQAIYTLPSINRNPKLYSKNINKSK